MDKIYIINYLADKIKAKKYLEIGVDQGISFRDIKIENIGDMIDTIKLTLT